MVVLSSKTLLVKSTQKPEASKPKTYTYKINKMRLSESALVFFARRRDTQQRVVIKILCDYEDTRYSLSDPQKRLACQIEALQWNQKFTPGIYFGLGCIVSPDLKRLTQIANEGQQGSNIIIENPVDDIQQLSTITEANAEYALVMECLPKERRLDYLLRQKNKDVIKKILETLICRIVEMHKLSPSSADISCTEDGKIWGSYEQIRDKLHHNIDLFNNLEQLENRSFYDRYCYLTEDLNRIIEDPRWNDYFSERLKQDHIKRCHGDLKARNIWIEQEDQSINCTHQVRILDAIDFNPSYCNIDVLSDIAMLAIDTQAVDMQLHQYDGLKNRGLELADFIMKTYFSLTKQENDPLAQKVLTYYLLEKALVRASVSLFYDRNEYPQLGTFFLRIAAKHMVHLKHLLGFDLSHSVNNLMMIPSKTTRNR